MFVNLLFRFIYLCLAISQTYLGLFIITIHLITSLYLIIKLNVIQEYFNTYIRLYNYLKDFYYNNSYNIISIILLSIIIYNIEIIMSIITYERIYFILETIIMSIIVYLIAVCIYFLLYRNDNGNDSNYNYKNNYDYYYYDKNYDIIYYEKREKKSRKD